MTQLNISAVSKIRTALRRGTGAVLLFVLAGCSAFQTETTSPEKPKSTAVALPPIASPGKYAHRESQYVFYSDYPLESNLPLFKELGELREQICSELKLPLHTSNNFIQVFLFEDEERYEKFMRSRYSELPVRRAFFIKQPRNTGGMDDLLVFTYRGKDMRQDLRHELTHGFLHSVLKDVPLWLDEGLAEIYELSPEKNGVNRDHLTQIRTGLFEPDMAKLEQLSEVKQMLRPQYREAWAWVHFMLRGKPESKAVLLSYLQQLRNPNPPGQLLPKLREVYPEPNEAMVEHLSKMEAPRSVRASSEKP